MAFHLFVNISWLLLIICGILSEASERFFPVVYVVFGEIPTFVKLNVEVAVRHNNVVIISDSVKEKIVKKNVNNGSYDVIYENLNLYVDSANQFAPHYIHLSKDQSPRRKTHERQCIQRWFVLMEYMKANLVPVTFFGDGDSTVFDNMEKAFQLRSHCAACINIEKQGHDYHWVGAGEASLWTIDAIKEFCQFAMTIYLSHKQLLHMKGDKGSSVVDMSILWLWWVAHKSHLEVGYETGRPVTSSSHDIEISDKAFKFAAQLALPSVNRSLLLCNGLDVYNRTVFDHMHAWNNRRNFTLNLESGLGIPYFYGAATYCGGKPESLEKAEIDRLEHERLYVLNMHYQGGTKQFMNYDLCRVLQFTGIQVISDPEIRDLCAKTLQGKSSLDQLHCVNHDGEDRSTCI
jgi:hypothetical protein